MPADFPRLGDHDLPPFFHAADQASQRAQSATLRGNRLRLIGAVSAALGGSFSLATWNIDFWAILALAGFLVAMLSELFLMIGRSERLWYQNRAAAESAKTLSWRYAVGADPFFLSMSSDTVTALFRARIGQVAGQVADAMTMPSGDASGPTAAMERLRLQPIEMRRATYLRDRTEMQRDWYSKKAKAARSASTRLRLVLLSAELIAVILAAGRVFGNWPFDLANVLAAFVGAGAAWLGLKQYTTLATAYGLTAVELEKQISVLKLASEDSWPSSVADAEEAISREHTMWLASRGEVNERIG